MKNKTVNERNFRISKAGIKRLVICLVALLLLVGCVMGILAAVNAYRNSGKSIRAVKVLESEHFTLTLPMYAYYYRSMEDGVDFDLVAMALTEQLALYEAALADGESLDDVHKAALEEQIALMEAGAKKLDISIDEYLSIHYGRGIKLSDIRPLLEMTALANQKYEAVLKSFAFDEDALADYCKDNEDSFLCCDYLFHVFSVPLTEDMTKAEKEQLIAQYKGYADQLADCTDTERFLSKVVAYEQEFAKKADENATFTDDDIASIRKSAIYEADKYVNYLELADDNPIKETISWLFGSDRKVGETKVVAYENLEKNSATFGIYYVTRPLYTNEAPTHTVYDVQLPFSKYTESAAESGIADVESTFAKAPSEETVKMLAEMYQGGLFENVECTTSLNDELRAWLLDAPKAGQTLTYKGIDGWHFVYYKQQGMPASYVQAEQMLSDKAYEETMQGYRDAHAVSVTPGSYKNLPELRYGWFIL